MREITSFRFYYQYERQVTMKFAPQRFGFQISLKGSDGAFCYTYSSGKTTGGAVV